ncbi:hypothetical protein ACC671_11005 [Rhizobium ruizarguesonis]
MVALSVNAPVRINTLHEAIIGRLPRPYWLTNDSLLDNEWIIQIGEEETHPAVRIDFNAPITSWPNSVSLTDDSFESDLITIKMVIYFSLKPKPLGWLTSASSLGYLFSTHVDFVRWRVDRGVTANSNLSPEWFNEFDASFKNGTREGLLRLAQRASPVLEAVKAGTLSPQRDDRKGIAGDAFARLVGVTKAVSLTSSSRLAIEGFFRANGIRFTRTARSRKTPVNIKTEITSNSAWTFYSVWFDLWRLRDHLRHDPIGYRAFRSRIGLSRYVRTNFPPPTPTEDTPAYQASCLINSALKLLLDPVCDKFLELVESGGINENKQVVATEAFSECNRRLQALDLPEIACCYHTNRWVQSASPTIFQFIFEIIPIAARIVTAAFSARRDDEITTSKIDCIQIDANGDTWLECMIVKNVDHRDLVPVPKSVARAVEVVRRVRALGQKTSKKLYDFACPILKRPVKFDLHILLNKVRDYFRVPLLDDGTAWRFKPHQFRKFFAVTYFWRWAFPNLTALTYHLRHFNPDTTRAYIEMKAAAALRMQDEKLAEATRKRDRERMVDFDSTKSSFALWTLKEVASGGTLGGSLGRRINAQVDALKAQFQAEIQVTEMEDDAPSFDQMLSKLAGTISLDPHPEGHSLCGWGTGPDGIKQQQCMSRCLQLKEQLTGQSITTASAPDFGFAEDTGCLVCPLRAALPSMAPRWEAEIRDAEQALLDANDEFAPIIRERIRMIIEYA